MRHSRVLVKGRRKLHDRMNVLGMKISIENRAGSVRRGKDEDGASWKTVMVNPYGYIRGTMGVDGDHLDVFIGPELLKMKRTRGKQGEFDKVWIVHQKQKGKRAYDEDKVMLGYRTKEEAVSAYKRHYDDPEAFLGPISECSLDDFKDMIKDTKENPRRLGRGRVFRG